MLFFVFFINLFWLVVNFIYLAFIWAFMENVVLLPRTDELERISVDLGFDETVFLGDVGVVKGDSQKELLRSAQKSKAKIVVYKATTEELLRFVLEKVHVDIVYGVENIHPKDSVHYVRGGLDQVLCKIAREKGKKIGFSFSEILNSSNRGKLLARMMLNIRLCKKYGVKMVFSNFSLSKIEMRSKKDLDVFRKLLGW